ncbi:caspase a-like [Stigmatopora argus]
MAEELKDVRTGFVEGVSIAVIRQLLDDLLDEKVFNYGEMEAIDEGQSRVNKARLFIDMVTKKGDEASWKAITYLYERDQNFATKLGLPRDRPQGELTSSRRSATSIGKSPASGAEFEWSKTLVRCKKTFWNSKKNDPQIYPVTEKSTWNRMALLINNIKFKDPEQGNRQGADTDQRNMNKLLQALGYEVVNHTNLTGKQIDKAIVDFSKDPKLKDTDSVIVVIMSHGKKDFILGVDWTGIQRKHEEDVFAIDKIFKHLAPGNCKALMDKPKIIIIQACQGKNDGKVKIRDNADGVKIRDNADGVKTDSCHSAARSAPAADADADGGAGSLKWVHEEKDFLSLLSCTPDTVAHRDVTKGAYFIQYIVDALNTFACKDHINEIYRKVMRRFEKQSFAQSMQMATIARDTMTKDFYLFPGVFPVQSPGI